MLPELILKEERTDNFPLLFVLGVMTSFIGFFAAEKLFPSEASVLTVVFAAIPLVYPLVTKFLEDENEDARFYFEEIGLYAALFAGQATGFTLMSILRPEAFTLQAQVVGLTGNATVPGLFAQILSNNLIVFTGILSVSAVIGSAGAFILAWNASVLGKFFATLLNRLEGNEILTGNAQAATPLAYLPHAIFEMTGFIIAGIAGSFISAAIYREHFDKDTWTDIAKLTVAGVICVVIGAVVEAA